jgi:hypothetical protein
MTSAHKYEVPIILQVRRAHSAAAAMASASPCRSAAVAACG